MDKAMPNWAFRGMTFLFSIRDAFEPRARVLQEAQLEPGFHVLDYGIGYLLQSRPEWTLDFQDRRGVLFVRSDVLCASSMPAQNAA